MTAQSNHFDPAEGTPGIDDNAPGSPPDPDPAPGRRLAFAYAAMPCKHCRRAILLGPVVCDRCKTAGYCTICGERHRPTQCPEVVKVRLEQEAIAAAERRQTVSDWSAKLLAQYMADPIAA